MATIRIKDQTTVTILQAGDYVIVDTEESGVGTRKLDLGSELDEIKTELQELINRGGGTGLTDAEKSLILTLFNQAAYSENDAGTAYNQLSNLWSGYSITWSGSGYTHSNNSSSITGGSTFTSTVSASSGFTITGVVATMGGNTVQGAWQNGTVTIPNVTGNIVITVTTSQATVSSISAVYTQSGTVYDSDTLNSLKSDLVVTATYVDQSTYTVPSAEYTLSGTLTVGTSTITVSYGGKTTTFTVTVTEAPLDTTAQLDTEHDGKGQANTFGSYSSKNSFCPTILYDFGTLSGVTYDYIKGIIPVDATSSSTCRVWLWKQDNTGTTASAYGTGKPMQVYDAQSMTEGSFSITVAGSDEYIGLTIPICKDYIDDAYLYVESSGKVLFAGKNTPYYGMSNTSEAS